MANRWIVYQSERFSLVQFVPLVAVFSYSAECYSSQILHQKHLPGLAAGLVGFTTSLLLFLQLRIADEFKDFDEDSRYRPYRAVPRGLVSLRELVVLFICAALIQLGLALWFYPPLAPLLFIVWAYLALMSREFFVREWLKAHPFVYLWSHMLIMPLIDFYVTACNWMPASSGPRRPPPGLIWFLVISFFNGIVLEFGRKIRAPEDEEEGVPTYTAIWGRQTAVRGWLFAMLLTSLCAWYAATLIGFLVPVITVTLIALTIAAGLSWQFLTKPIAKHAKAIDTFSGIWTICMYISVGLAPRLIRFF